LIKSLFFFYRPVAPGFDVSLSPAGWFSLVKFTILPVTVIDFILIRSPEMSWKCKYDGKAHFSKGGVVAINTLSHFGYLGIEAHSL